MVKNNKEEIILLSKVIFVFIIIKPIVYFAKIFPNNINKLINFKLISLSNYFFKKEELITRITKVSKYNIRGYRDNYDRNGLELYFKLIDSDLLIKEKNILDFGCGLGGKDIEILKYSPKKIIGIDMSKRNIKYASELINKRNRNTIRFINKNIFNIKFKNKFDTIISFTVFEHILPEDIIKILNYFASIIKPNGNILIVFNHYNDKFGSHLKEYIYHPWPQMIFDEEYLFEYWNQQLINDPNINNNSYFPKYYKHGINRHNSDCFMNLNKITIEEFVNIIKKSKLKLINFYNYSEFKIKNKIKIFPKKYLLGSVVYHLKIK